MTQETLEEFSERYTNMQEDVSETIGKYLVKAVFKDGAYWNQEISYSEEEVEILLETLSKVLVYQGNEYRLPHYFEYEIEQVIKKFKKL